MGLVTPLSSQSTMRIREAAGVKVPVFTSEQAWAHIKQPVHLSWSTIMVLGI
jgi:hypothetical protein